MTKDLALRQPNSLDTVIYQGSPSILQAAYVDAENQYWYIVTVEASSQTLIRKMSIKNDIQRAREVNIKAKRLIGKKVHIGSLKGWNSQVWFCDIVSESDFKEMTAYYSTPVLA